MPLLKIQTSLELDEEQRSALLQKASHTASQALGKSESYVMISLEARADIRFAGDDGPAAYLELKSINLPESDTADLSRTLCELVSGETGIAPDRVYIEFSNAERHMWGFDGRTF